LAHGAPVFVAPRPSAGDASRERAGNCPPNSMVAQDDVPDFAAAACAALLLAAPRDRRENRHGLAAPCDREAARPRRGGQARARGGCHRSLKKAFDRVGAQAYTRRPHGGGKPPAAGRVFPPGMFFEIVDLKEGMCGRRSGYSGPVHGSSKL
jgi:hypothetical protein